MERYKNLCSEQKWILKGIVILFFVGSVNHFMFELLGKLSFFAFFSPTNESVFEHMKLGLWPMFLYWLLYYLVNRKKHDIAPGLWFGGCLIAVLSSVLMIPLVFYFYTEGLGIHSMVLDILLFFACVAAGQTLGFYYYKYAKGKGCFISMALIVLVLLSFCILTYFPLKLPIFQDPQTLSYGF